MDPEETLRLYYEKVHVRHAELVDKEAQWLAEHEVDMVSGVMAKPFQDVLRLVGRHA